MHSFFEAEFKFLREENNRLREEITQLVKENAKLREENARLKEHLNLNSKNSSKPPSSDQKGSSNVHKKGGAKPGHRAHHRSLFPIEQVHKRITLKVTHCHICGNSVQALKKPPSIHQQVEIPKVCFQITQYERHSFYCPCCRTYGVAPLPKEVGTSVFGTRLTAFISFLSGACRLSKRTVLSILKEGFGIKVRSSKDPKHIDETGWRQWGKKEYLWVMSTKKAVFYKIQKNRNGKSRDELLGKAKWAKSVFITDRLAIYRFESDHQYCLAHLKRKLKRFSERSGCDGEWANVMLDYLNQIFRYHQEYRKGIRTKRSVRFFLRRYRDYFDYGLLVAAVKEGFSSKINRFAKKLIRQEKNLWVFVENEKVEPTNNQAERDLRDAVIWRKICHGTKSDRGDRFVERIRSVIATLLREKQPCLQFLIKAIDAAKRDLHPPALLNTSY